MSNTGKIYTAHSENANGVTQTMREHSFGVGKLMRQFALSESFADLYEFCGLVHDMGKYSEAFQRHISGENSHVRHAIYGAVYAMELQPPLLETAMPVYGHHAGLPDRPVMLQDVKSVRISDNEGYRSICEAWDKDMGDDVTVPNDGAFRSLANVLHKELFVRMLFSALVDADSLDTERHFFADKFQSRNPLPLDSDKLLEKLQIKLRDLERDKEKSMLPINRLRNEVRLYAESKASMPQGCFSLTLPTGLGKTICSINWALHHAQHHRNVKRIIIVLPFISIIDQTAAILKEIFNGGDYVLEHHSNVVYQEDGTEMYSPKELAVENWDYPIIVTTSVQFFESLFSNQRTMCRKLHNIQDSIIIFDEIQTLPLHLTEPTLVMLDNLQQLCRCSLLFCTATQPDFESRDGFRGIKHIEPLVENPEVVFEKTRRVTYHPIEDYAEIPIAELADRVVDCQEAALVVFNTKKKARLFYEEMKNRTHHKLFHLSTSMCPSHRKKVITDIRDALQRNEYIVVCSTQLIEAGVDMDFPTVFRELAPLESIIQSAGRCNREGKRKNGNVFLFALSEIGQPSKQYRSFLEFANLLYRGNEERLHTHDFYSHYYREIVRNYANTDKHDITNDRQKLLFQTVAEKYRIIDNSTQMLFVYKYDEKSQHLYHRIKDNGFLSKREWQEVSQYCVQVYDNFVRNNSSFIGPEPCGVLVWHGSYSSDCGLPFVEDFNALII